MRYNDEYDQREALPLPLVLARFCWYLHVDQLLLLPHHSGYTVCSVSDCPLEPQQTRIEGFLFSVLLFFIFCRPTAVVM